MVETFLNHIVMVVADAKNNSDNEIDFINICKKRLNITNDKDFIDFYYHGIKKKKLIGGLINNDIE